MTRRLALSLAFVLAAGCVLKTSPPARVYVLDAVTTGPQASASAPAPRGVLGVMRVAVPDWIDRPEITARKGTGEIAPDGFARWGEPVGRGMQRVIAEDLARLLPGMRVAAAPLAAREDVDWRLEVVVLEAARQADGTALLEARWSLHAADGAALVQRLSSHRVGPARDAATTVAALDQALAALSGEIAEALRALPPPEPPAP
jgi:uncharacterized lipoprotein YmbA